MTPYILSLIIWYSSINGLDPYLVAGVIQKESSFRVRAVGAIGEKGLMQLRPEYFEGAEDKDLYPIKIEQIHIWEKGTILENTKKKREHSLFNPEANIAAGTSYLKELKRLCPHKKAFELLVCYNRGPTGGRRVKNPELDKYVKDVTIYAAQFREKQVFKLTEVSFVLR